MRLLKAFCPSCRGRSRGLLRCLRRTPVVMEIAILIWAYYAYVIVMCNRLVLEKNGSSWFLYVLGFHVTLIGSLWPFERLLTTPLKPVPVCFYVMQKSEHTIRQRRYCHQCHLIKPERCHHCSVCGTCVLKMDHHCPWFDTCVSFGNYKFFLLFLFYSAIHCTHMALTTRSHFGINTRLRLGFWPNLHITFLFLLSLFFSAAFTLLFLYHVYLVCRNRTTLEMVTGCDKRRYDLGASRNLAEVLGPRKLLWLVPIFTGLGDGAAFPSSKDVCKTEVCTV